MAVVQMNYGLKDIKAAFSELRKARAVLTWEEFADKIGYNRAYVSRVVNGHEPLTDDFRKSVKKFVDTTKLVPLEGGQYPDTRMQYTPITTTDKHTSIAVPSEKDQRIMELEARLEKAEKEKERLYELLNKAMQKS